MKITGFKEKQQGFNIKGIDIVEVRKTIKEQHGSQKLNSIQKQADKNFFAFIKLINKQLENKKCLNLYDSAIAEELKITVRQAKRLKERASKLGVIFVPEYGKQWFSVKANRGQSAMWLVSMEFLIVEDSKSSEKAKRCQSLAVKQAKAYIQKEVKEIEEFMRLEDSSYEFEINIKEYMQWVYYVAKNWNN